MLALDILLLDTRNTPTNVPTQHGLSASTLTKLAQISNVQRVQQIVLGRHLLAFAASRLLGENVLPGEIIETDTGYPIITGHGTVFANLSHSHQWLAAVSCRTQRIGLDIEVARKHDVLALAERAFDTTDAALIRDAAPTQAQSLFQAAWTLREAAYKAGLRTSVLGAPAVLSATLPHSQLLTHSWQDDATQTAQTLQLAVVAPVAFTARLQLLDSL